MVGRGVNCCPVEDPGGLIGGLIGPSRIGLTRTGLTQLACFTRQPENSKRAHLRVPDFKNTTKIQREDPQRERKRATMGAGEAKKSAKFWAVRRRGVRRRGFRAGGPAQGVSGGGDEKKIKKSVQKYKKSQKKGKRKTNTQFKSKKKK